MRLFTLSLLLPNWLYLYSLDECSSMHSPILILFPLWLYFYSLSHRILELYYIINTHRLIKLQKRAIRIITDSKYNSHTEPLLKSLNILKINDIFTIQCLKFFHNYINDRVPVFFRSFFVEHALYHDYETRHCHNICIPQSYYQSQKMY